MSIEEKSARLEAARAKLEQFKSDGGDLSGDLKSPEAAPLGIEFLQAFSDLAKELGLDSKEPIQQEDKSPSSPTLEAFLKLFSFDKKRDVEKYCRGLTIRSTDFVNFIIACEMGQSPFVHQIHYRDHVPEHLQPTDDDLAALVSNGVGLLKPDAQKFVRKIGQILKGRRYLVGHIFHTPDLSQWHFFQFDQRDLQDEENHWKEGAHIHFLNWLWPNQDPQILLD